MGKEFDVPSKIRHWCARAERSPAQAFKKLKEWGASGDLEALIAQLIEEGYLDERRFAEAFVHDHVRLKNWGPLKVRAALSQVHRIESRSIDDAMTTLGGDAIEEASHRAVAAWRRLRPEAPREKALAAMVRKGFSMESALKAVEAMEAD